MRQARWTTAARSTSARRLVLLSRWSLLLAIALVMVSEGVATASAKGLASGLMTVGNTGEWPNIVDVWDPQIEWRELQPHPDRFSFKPIKDMIANAEASGAVLRLRILAGRYAPRWVKQRFGTVAMYDPVDNVNARVPRWWLPRYMRVYKRFQAHLAARFDGDPTIRAVTVAGATTIYCEPFIRGVTSRITRDHLIAAGYSPRKDKRAILASIAAQGPWKRTRQILALNPWQFVRQDGTNGFSTRFTDRAMNRFRRIFGVRAILQNNSIRSSWITRRMPAGYGPMFRHMRALGPPISFQTARTARVGNLATVLRWALKSGAHGVELHRGSTTKLTTDQAIWFDTQLQANAG